jgi:hypothetical protein
MDAKLPSRAIVECFEHDPATVQLLDRDLRLVWCNAAWDKFAALNGGNRLLRSECVGRFVMDSVCAELRDFYLNAYSLVRRYQREVGHVYECSSPEIERRFHMRILPAGESGIVVVHSLVSERVVPVGMRGDYQDAEGVVHMCAHCRRCQRPGAGDFWDWVPKLVAEIPERTAMGLCGFCLEYHYPERGAAGA